MTLKNFIAMANGEYTLTVIDDTEHLCEYKKIGNLQYPGDMIDNWDDIKNREVRSFMPEVNPICGAYLLVMVR